MAVLYTVSALIIHVSLSLTQDVNLEKPQIYSMNIHSDITYRYATTKVTSRVKNPGSQPREAIFDVTLPNEAFITNLTIEIDGNITVGEIKKKEDAKAEYEAAKQRGESAGYIGTKHRETNKFNLAISVAPLSKISFNLTYQELLKRKLGFYEQVIFIDPGQTVHDLQVTVAIQESRNITRLTVPALRNDVGETVSEVKDIVVIGRPTEKSALVKYAPTVEQQKRKSESGIAGRFIVQYDVERDFDIGDVMMVNGYFVHFFAPEGLKPIPNDVLFILDVSGSMQGRKLAQLKKAMLSNLQQLNPHDRFNMMTFSNTLKFWRKSMADVDEEDAMEDAKSFITTLRAKGWTDINQALTKGINFLVDQLSTGNQTRSPIIVFLTDGEPTQGEEDPNKILINVARSNEGDIPIFTLAFGTGADWNFVLKLALQNDGFGRKIYEASDADLQIMGFYNEISVTLLSNITFKYLDVETSNVTQTHFTNYFNGSEVVVCGVLPYDTREEMQIEVSYNTADETKSVVLSGGIGQNIFGDLANETNAKDYEKITEKVWAYLTIKELLKKVTATDTSQDKDKYNHEILRLSLEYGFVTPLTSMVVTQAKDDPLPEPSVEVVEEDDDLYGPIQPKRLFARPRPAFSRGSPALNGIMHDPVLGADLHSPTRHFAFAQIDHGHGGAAKHPSRKRIRRPTLSAGSVSTPRKRVHKLKKMRGRNRKQKQQKRGKKWNFPLFVKYANMTQGMCFSLYDKVLDNGPKKYLFYSNKDTGVEINAFLSTKTVVGRRFKLGSIRQLEIVTADGSVVLNSQSSPGLSNIPPTPKHYDVTRISGVAAKFTFGSDVILVQYSQLHDELYVSFQNEVENRATGILGKILNLDIEFIKSYKKRAKKTVTLLKIQGKSQTAVLRDLSIEVGGQDECLSLNPKKESKLYKMDG